MRTLIFALLMCGVAVAQEPGHPNPRLQVYWPLPNAEHNGLFVVIVENFTYKPELATDPVTEFAIGQDSRRKPLVSGEGHVHGWVFRRELFGDIERSDGDFPTPQDYVRFYGAGGADFYAFGTNGYYVKFDALPPGEYRAYFQLQQNDHTAALQATAPAFPAIASVDFYVAGPRPTDTDRDSEER